MTALLDPNTAESPNISLAVLQPMADWKEALQWRIECARVRLNLGLPDNDAQLAAEVVEFTAECRRLCREIGDHAAIRPGGVMSYSPLDLLETYLRRFVAYPSKHALVAHVLWIAHAHLIECFDTTPRLAFMSAEKESGKTRALEVTALFVPDPILSISASPAVIVRLVTNGKPTILYDEIDGVFGNAKVQEANTDLRSVLNGGYRRGAKVHRCVMHGNRVETEELDAFAPVAVAGLRDLPDTLASRSIFISMRRRAPNENVEPFRHRYHSEQAKPIKEFLVEWCAEHEPHITGAEPEMPKGIEDRAADCWEPLLAIADRACTDWPQRAREAAVYLTLKAADESLTKGVELLSSCSGCLWQ